MFEFLGGLLEVVASYGDLLEVVAWIVGIVVWFVEVVALYRRYSKDLDGSRSKKTKG